MAQTAGMRATSLAASAALLSAGAFVALTFSYELPRMEFPFLETPPVDMAVEPSPPPPEPVRRPLEQPRTEQVETISTIATVGPDILDMTSPPADFSAGEPYLQTVTSPYWLRRPTNLQRYYPRRALAMGTEGDVVLDCLVSTAGFLRCTVVSETPAGSGLSDAALRIAADHQMRPAMRDGIPVEGRYRMRVPFRVE